MAKISSIIQVSYLKRADQQKEAEIARLEEVIRDLKKQHRAEKEASVDSLSFISLTS